MKNPTTKDWNPSSYGYKEAPARCNSENQSFSSSNIKYLQKIDQMIFPPTQHDKSQRRTPISREDKENPTDYREVIEERFDRATMNRSYSFPRKKSPQLRDYENRSSSSDSSVKSVKFVTNYNLHSQNQHEWDYDYTPVIQIKPVKQSLKLDCTRPVIDKTVKEKLVNKENKIQEGSSDKGHASENPVRITPENLTPSSYRKLVCLIEKQLDSATNNKCVDLADEISQQNWARKWFETAAANNWVQGLQNVCPNNSCLSQKSCQVEDKEVKKEQKEQQPEKQTKQEVRDINEIGKRSYHLRKISRQRQPLSILDDQKLRVVKSYHLLPRDASPKTNPKVRETTDMSASLNTRTMSTWDFGPPISVSHQRSGSPGSLIGGSYHMSPKSQWLKTENLLTITEDKPAQKKGKSGGYKASIGGIQGHRKQRGLNYSLVPQVPEQYSSKGTIKDRLARSISKSSSPDHLKTYKSDCGSPTREVKKGNTSNILKDCSTVYENKRIKIQATKSTVLEKPEKVHSGVYNDFRKQGSVQEKKSQRNQSSPSKVKKPAKACLEPQGKPPFQRPQQYSLFLGNNSIRELNHKTAITSPKGKILKNLFFSTVKR